jgi:hypothetical protein
VEDIGDMIDEDAELISKMFDVFNGDPDEAAEDSKKK